MTASSRSCNSRIKSAGLVDADIFVVAMCSSPYSLLSIIQYATDVDTAQRF
jgi:hypothetical protein